MSKIAAYTQVFENWSMPIMVLDTDLKFAFANDAYLTAVHKTFEELDGMYVFDAFPEALDRINPILEKFKATLGGAVTQLDAQPFELTLEDGRHEERVWQATQDPMRATDGTIIGLIQRCENITLQHKLSQQNKAITHELSHRVKNITAVVTSVARITSRSASNLEGFIDSFTSRLGAMDRTNDLLSLGDWNGVTIRDLLKDELTPFDQTPTQPYTLQGPDVRLSVSGAKDLSLVCHELSTNAAKYGCFSQHGGTLNVSWSRADNQLNLTWREHCPEGISDPEADGFGTRLFQLLPYVSVTRDFTATGMHLTITMDGENLFA